MLVPSGSRAVIHCCNSATVTSLNVVLGKSPGETPRKIHHEACTLEAQQRQCNMCFDRKYGKGKWKGHPRSIGDVPARVCKAWPKQLRTIIEGTNSTGAVLATAQDICPKTSSSRCRGGCVQTCVFAILGATPPQWTVCSARCAALMCYRRCPQILGDRAPKQRAELPTKSEALR